MCDSHQATTATLSIRGHQEPSAFCKQFLPSMKAVVPKLVRAVTKIIVAIMSYYPQYFAS